MELLEQLVEMEKKAAQSSGDEAAAHYFQMGNALYNTNIWTGSGITWQSDTVDWLWNDYTVATGIQPMEYPFNVPGFATDLHNRKTAICYEQLSATLAMKYYEKAAAVAKDRELIAQALFCAKAAAARYRDFGMAMSNMPDEVNMGEDRFFRKLKDEYSDTKAYRELSESCPQLADFQ